MGTPIFKKLKEVFMRIKVNISRLPEPRLPPTRGFRSQIPINPRTVFQFRKESQERGVRAALAARGLTGK